MIGSGDQEMGSYVLVVDDQAAVRELIMDVLESTDIPGKEAPDGIQALKMVQEDPPSAILLDLMMPVMSGFALLTHLQSNKASRGIPIILLSGVSDNSSQMRNLPGVVGVLRKGEFSVAELRSMVALALKDNEVA